MGLTGLVLPILPSPLCSPCFIVSWRNASRKLNYGKVCYSVLFVISACITLHYITFPLLGLTPPVAEWPLYEHISELVGHIFWFWTIELIRRDLRNRITHEPDPEVPLGQYR